MPRHSGGMNGSSKPRGGKLSRRTRTPKNTYDPNYRRADWNVAPRAALAGIGSLPIFEMGRRGGSSATAQPNPQTSKQTSQGTTKGGSKPASTKRGK